MSDTCPYALVADWRKHCTYNDSTAVLSLWVKIFIMIRQAGEKLSTKIFDQIWCSNEISLVRWVPGQPWAHNIKCCQNDLPLHNMHGPQGDKRLVWRWLVIEYNIKILLHMDGLVQERHNSSALAMELRLSCTNPLIWYPMLLVGEIWRYHSECTMLFVIDWRALISGEDTTCHKAPHQALHGLGTQYMDIYNSHIQCTPRSMPTYHAKLWLANNQLYSHPSLDLRGLHHLHWGYCMNTIVPIQFMWVRIRSHPWCLCKTYVWFLTPT